MDDLRLRLVEIVGRKRRLRVVARHPTARHRRLVLRLLRLLRLLDGLVAELAEHRRGALVRRIEREDVLQGRRGSVAVERVELQRRDVEHLDDRVFLLARLEVHVAELGARGDRSPVELERANERAHRAVVEAHAPVRLRLGDEREHARVLLAVEIGDVLFARGAHLGRAVDRVVLRAVDRGRVFVVTKEQRLGARRRVGDDLLDDRAVDLFDQLGFFFVLRELLHLARAREHLVARGGELLHDVVVRRDREELVDELGEDVVPLLIARDARHLLLHLDALARLTELAERAREEIERREILRVRLNAELELRERLHPVVRRAALEIELGGEARLCGLGAVVEQALEDLERVVSATELDEQRGGLAELRHCAVGVPRAREGLGEAQVRDRVRRIERDDLAEDVERLGVALLTLVARRDLVERGERVAHQPELLIELGELRRDVRVPLFEVRHVLLHDLADLLVDRDGLERESLRRVVAADALVGRDRLGVGLHLQLQVTHLQQRPSVVRIAVDELLVLEDRLVVALLLYEFRGGLEDLFTINRHGLRHSIGSDTAHAQTIRRTACLAQGTSDCLSNTQATDKKAAARRAPTRIPPLRPDCILPAATFLAFAPITWCSPITTMTAVSFPWNQCRCM